MICKSLISLVPKGGLEPPCPQGAPDFEYLKPSKPTFFNMTKILSILYFLNALGYTHSQIQSGATRCFLEAKVTI